VTIVATGQQIQEELDHIAGALRRAPSPERYSRLYAAQQALSWALDPTSFRAPYSAVMSTPADLTGCLVCPGPPSS
jgi:hypothetical protein